jgi:hypothetical protein
MAGRARLQPCLHEPAAQQGQIEWQGKKYGFRLCRKRYCYRRLPRQADRAVYDGENVRLKERV